MHRGFSANSVNRIFWADLRGLLNLFLFMEVITTREALEIAVQQAVVATLATFQPKEEPFLTVAQLAEKLSVSQSTVRSMAYNGVIPWVNVGSKGTNEYRFNLSAIEAALKNRGQV